ncbi:MAG TPA: sensor histidine kinase [Ardenticatenaceae bacterium]|nr:sensor histidine kinase [Ardenticatenaceae bacterium]
MGKSDLDHDDGAWNREGLVVRLIARLPWYRTTWAYSLFGIAAAALAGALIRGRARVQARELAARRRELERERHLRERIERIEQLKDEDRARIARELHDGVAQTLAGLRFRARSWPALLERDPDRLRTELDELPQLLAESIEELRHSIFALRPVTLDELGFVAAVAQVIDTIERRYHVPIEAQLSEKAETLPDALQHALFRAIQELLHNAARHAAAAGIWLTLAVTPGAVTLAIRDDGDGFDPAFLPNLARQGHLGLRQLRERAELLGGTLAVESAPGQGTTVQVTLPRREIEGQ